MAYIVNKIKSIELAKYDESGYHYFISKNGEVAKECIYNSGDDYYTEINFEHSRQVFISESVKAQITAYCAEMKQTASDAMLLMEGFRYSAFDGKPLIWRLYGYKEKLPIYEFFCFDNDGNYWYFLDSVSDFFNKFSFESYSDKAMAENSNIEYFAKCKEQMPLIDCAERAGDNYLAGELKWILRLATINDAEYLTSVDNLPRFVADEAIYDCNRITIKAAKLCHHGTQISGIKTFYSVYCVIDGKSYMAEWKEDCPATMVVLSYNRSGNIAISKDIVEQIKSKLQ